MDVHKGTRSTCTALTAPSVSSTSEQGTTDVPQPGTAPGGVSVKRLRAEPTRRSGRKTRRVNTFEFAEAHVLKHPTGEEGVEQHYNAKQDGQQGAARKPQPQDPSGGAAQGGVAAPRTPRKPSAPRNSARCRTCWASPHPTVWKRRKLPHGRRRRRGASAKP